MPVNVPVNVPVNRRLRRPALALASLGLAALSLAPAQSASAARVQDGAQQRTGAVALTAAETRRFDKTRQSRKARAAKRLNQRVLSAQRTALAQRGDAYAYGAAGPHAFDCSGLVAYSYGRAGFRLPRTSGAQAAATRRISKSAMRPGDLMFFHSGGNVYHAAVFVGYRGRTPMMVHAPGSGRSVTVAAPWTSSWFAGTLR